MKRAFFTQDWEKSLVRGGKFGESVLKALHFIRTGVVIQTVSAENEINDIAKCTSLPESIRLLVPRSIRVLYDHRSKRGGAHASFDPQQMDCSMAVSIADWTLAELVRVYCTENGDAATEFVRGVISRSLPYVEQIDGDFVTLETGLSARQEIGRILYARYPERTSTAELKKWVLGQSEANIAVTLTNMRKERQIHSKDQGHLLTALGIRTVEKEID